VQYSRHELEAIGKAVNSKLFITTSSFRDYKLAEEAVALGVKVFSFGTDIPESAIPLTLDATTDSQVLTKHKNKYIADIDDANQILTICWTSGTTGTPKGVPRSHNMWLATTQVEIDGCDYRNGDHLLNPFPLVNMAAIGGFLFPSALIAGSLFLHHPLEPAVYLQQLQQEKINFTIAPPALLNQLAKSQAMWDQFDFSALRRIGSGSAPLAPWMVETFSKKYGKEIINFYGSNEGICLLSTVETSPLPAQRASLFPRLDHDDIKWQGTLYDMVKTKVRNITTGEEITEPGIQGELVISGPTIFDGYLNPSVDEKNDLFSHEGYFRTGDMVEICGEDNLYYQIVGRCKDIINRGGIKISPVEIDSLLASMPAIKEVAVCAYPDERLGEKVCACVVPIDDKEMPTLAELKDYLNTAGIAKYKVPERIEQYDILPRNPMGKVLRFQLQAKISS
jgi:acyl-CoA synthetase (AMP-forming)/AMP-acid ligase II